MHVLTHALATPGAFHTSSIGKSILIPVTYTFQDIPHRQYTITSELLSNAPMGCAYPHKPDAVFT